MKTTKRGLGTALILAVMLIVGACGKSTPTAEPIAERRTATAIPTPISAATSTPETEKEVEGPAPEDVMPEPPPVQPGMCEAAPLPELPVRPVDETDYPTGASAEDATLTLYEYSDFQCPGCAGMAPVVKTFLADHPEIRLVYRHFPLDFHQLAPLAAQAAEAAGAQDKFWEMHDILFERATEWGSGSEEDARAKMSTYAEELELDVERFDGELDAGTYAEKVQAHYEEAASLGLPGTPSFVFGNILFPSDIGLSYQGMVAFLDILENQDELFFDAPPEMKVAESDAYEATLETSKGDIVIELLPESAPTHVNSFVFLAEEKWYDGSEFFFVQDNFVAVTGDPTNSTIGYPGYYCAGEEQGTFDDAGLVGILSNGQFFVTLGSDASQLTGQFALIGKVTSGMEILDTLTRYSPAAPPTSPADVLETIDVVKK